MIRARTTLAVALFASVTVSQASLSQRTTVPAGNPTPVLLRADQPNRAFPYPSGTNGTTGDPSMASEFNATRDGINLNGVGWLATGGLACTSSRIGARTMLTAAHCVTDENTGALIAATSDLYGFASNSSVSSPAYSYLGTSSSIVVRPEWQGFNNTYNTGFDVAVINFSFDLPSWMTTYGLYTPDPMFMPTTHAGIGGYGNGTQGDVGIDYNRRMGNNRVDFYDDSSLGYWDWNILWTDFDDGTAQHDAFCYYGLCDLGRGPFEAALAGGDSGGPLFIGNQLAGVASFYYAAVYSALADPNVPEGYGTLNGFAGVRGNRDFIMNSMAVEAVPEPASLVLLGTGLLFIGGLVRGRRAA